MADVRGSDRGERDDTIRMDLAQGQSQDSVCVLTFARAPGDSEVLADSDTVLVALDFRDGPPQDSARIDFSLPSR